MGLKYSKTRRVCVISERGRNEGFLELSQGPQARTQYLNLFRGSGCWDNLGLGCLELLHRGANRGNEALPALQLQHSQGRTQESCWHRGKLAFTPTSNWLPSPRGHVSWECPRQEHQTTPNHSSSSVQALLGPQPLTLVCPSPSEQDRSPGIWALPLPGCQRPSTTEGCRDTRLSSSRSRSHWMGLGGR